MFAARRSLSSSRPAFAGGGGGGGGGGVARRSGAAVGRPARSAVSACLGHCGRLLTTPLFVCVLIIALAIITSASVLLTRSRPDSWTNVMHAGGGKAARLAAGVASALHAVAHEIDAAAHDVAAEAHGNDRWRRDSDDDDDDDDDDGEGTNSTL